MLHAIAIDDEPIALEVIKSLAAKIPFLQLRACFTNAFDAVDCLQKGDIDLLFLDIKMPDISGIDFIQSIPHPPMIIFTTAYSEHAVESFELNTIDYLLKPFSQARFLKACNKAWQQNELKRQAIAGPGAGAYIFIKSGYEQIRVGLDEILYVQSTGNYMQFVLADRKITSRLTMSEAEALLPAGAFVRAHRSYIVGIQHISKIEKDTIRVKQADIPIGAAYVQEVEKIINR